MCEPPAYGVWGEPSSTGTPTHRPPDYYRSSRFQETQAVDDEISMPGPDTAPCHGVSGGELLSSPMSSPSSKQSAQPIDLLVNQLRKQSLKQPDTTPTELPYVAALMPQATPEDDERERLLQNLRDTPMEVDDTEDASGITSISDRVRNCITSSKGKSVVPTMDSSEDHANPQLSTHSVPQSASTPSTTIVFSRDVHGIAPIEVDEGYCEDDDDDDYSWLAPLVEPSSATFGGVTKRYGLRYRTSAEAARNCSNLVRVVPRMRRREKKRSRQSRQLSRAAMASQLNQ